MAFALVPVAAGQQVPSADWRLAVQSSAIVEATITSVDWIVHPERMARRANAAGVLRAPNLNEYADGYVRVLQVTDVVKPDGIVAVNGTILLPTAMATDELFNGKTTERFLLFLRPVWGTPDEARLTGSKRLSLTSPPSSITPSALPDTNVNAAYEVIQAVPTTQRDYSAYKEAVRALRVPRVWVTTPLPGASIAGTVKLAAEGYDDNAVSSVQFQVDGVDKGPLLTARPFEFMWFSKSVPNGTHSLAAVARDGSGNAKTSAAVSLSIANTNVGPTVGGGQTWNATGWACRSAHAIKVDPDGDPLVCQWYIGNGGAGQCRPNCGGCGPADDTCAGSNDPALSQTECTISITCTDPWGVSDSESWTLNRF